VDEVPPVKKSRIVTFFKRKRDLPKEKQRERRGNRTSDDDLPENGPDDFSEGDERKMHRKWYRKHPSLLKKYLKRRLGRIRKAFFIDKKV
jgi:hypothetical protein